MDRDTSQDWQTITILSKGDESNQPMHTLSDYEEFHDIREQLNLLEQNYKGFYDELRIVYQSKSFGYGAVNYWYELQGRFTDPKKVVLYGQKDM